MQTLNEYKNQLFLQITQNSNIIKALVITEQDFLNTTPTSEQQSKIDSPTSLLYSQIYPYRNVTNKSFIGQPYITSMFSNIRKSGVHYQTGTIYFYVFVPNDFIQTKEGNRCDYICDEIDKSISAIGLGKFEFSERGDFVAVSEAYMGHYIAYKILDFYGL